jgi:type IV secretion system protein TrbG
MKTHQPFSRFARAVAMLSVTTLILPDVAAAQPGSALAPDEIHANTHTPQIIAVPVPLPLPSQLKPLSRRLPPPAASRSRPEFPCSQGSGGSGK